MVLASRRVFFPAAARFFSTPATEAEELAAMKEMVAEAARVVTPDHVRENPTGVASYPENPVEVVALDGMPEVHRSRTVTISQNPKSAMTSGVHKTKPWVLKWKNEERWSNPLMGWTSSADPMAQVELKFETPEQAIFFAEKHGWKYEVSEPIERNWDHGTNKYSHNFLDKTAEAEVKAYGKKTKRFDFSKPYASHYFRPLTYHGEKECLQHGLDPEKPWK
ncbi:hypothetical protein CTAYLR_001515 [Chrysophaeum taylorii]|uniref:NADH dehydrogenase [ubiquinone] iron-sulfur protein 4, mitochondrial n=1 Tax=Chrysophaeum taylorii TaxID=2483200 RepID=A0AAD7UE13_9STRA|nr:hypothetical protein CTAYLR_001515 [Chrysophaeum taylorii]